MRRRAVRSSAERVTRCGSAGSTPRVTPSSPDGCSTETVGSVPDTPAATSRATVPSMTQAVAAVTAASTPIDWWQTRGMRLRVVRVPPCRGGATRVIFG